MNAQSTPLYVFEKPTMNTDPTYIAVQRSEDGTEYMRETTIGGPLADVIEDLDGVCKVLMMEDFKIVDATAEAAEAWWEANVETLEMDGSDDLPEIVADFFDNEYADRCEESDYQLYCSMTHEQAFGAGL